MRLCDCPRRRSQATSGHDPRVVEEFESDPRVLAASGYAFEYVGPGVRGITLFCDAMEVHRVQRVQQPERSTANVWGGAMMFRASELRANIYGITDAWRDGGYSEDWITLTMARYHNRTLAVPKSAIFPNELGEIQFSRFWNLFVPPGIRAHQHVRDQVSAVHRV